MDLPRGMVQPTLVKQPTLRRSVHAISFLLSKATDKMSQSFPVLKQGQADWMARPQVGWKPVGPLVSSNSGCWLIVNVFPSKSQAPGHGTRYNTA